MEEHETEWIEGWKETYNLSFEDVLDLAYDGVHLPVYFGDGPSQLRIQLNN